MLPVITRELHKDDDHGKRCKLQSAIEFTIVAISNAFDAAGLNIDKAVARGKDALDHMVSTPSAIQEATDVLINDSKSVPNIWELLLQKVRLFTELVDAAAEVRD